MRAIPANARPSLMLPVRIHKEFRLLSATPTLTWAARTPPAAGARITPWWLYLAMRRANKLGLTLGGAGLATARTSMAS